MALSQLNTRLVLRNDDTAAWLSSKDVVLLKGEIGIEFDPNIQGKVRMKVGDGVKTWENLPYFGGEDAHVYEATVVKGGNHEDAITGALNGAEPNSHDVAIVKEAIIAQDIIDAAAAEDPARVIEQKYQHTAYRFDGENWIAFDGNYSAKNIYFDEDFTFTKAIGTVTIPSSGSKVVQAAGKNLSQFFSGIFAKEEYPSTPSTSASITSSNIGAKEVGTEIEVAYSFSTSAGAYKYGPSSNGVSWSNYSATFNGETKSTKTGTFSSVQVTDDTSLSITGSVSQSAGAVPKTNIGNDYAAAQIKAKDWTGLSKGTLTGYRAWFCGYKDGDTALADATKITGAQVRQLGNSANGSWLGQMEVTKMKQMFFAAPAGKGYKPVIKDASTTAPQTVLGPITVYVPGANNYMTEAETANGGMAYDVWYVANADAASGSATLNITRA